MIVGDDEFDAGKAAPAQAKSLSRRSGFPEERLGKAGLKGGFRPGAC